MHRSAGPLQLAVGAIVVVLAAAACSTSSKPTVAGVPVRNAQAILERTEARRQTPPGIEVRCFFVSLDESTEILPIMRCGPAGPSGSRHGPWHVYSLEAETVGNAIRLRVDEDYRQGWELLVGERLHRPDGLAPLPDGHNRFSPPTGAFRFNHPLVRSAPIALQDCMAQEGFIVFGIELRYDGQQTRHDNEIVTHISYVSHDSVTWNGEPHEGELAAKDECMKRVATGSGVGLEEDSGQLEDGFSE